MINYFFKNLAKLEIRSSYNQVQAAVYKIYLSKKYLTPGHKMANLRDKKYISIFPDRKNLWFSL